MNKNNIIEQNVLIANSLNWEHVIAVTGALGSGKTEFTISLAHALASNSRKVVLADMDIINPYFCLRTTAREIELGNLTLLTPPGETKWGDMSYINPKIRTEIHDESSQLIIDVGGDSQGALALKQFEPEIVSAGYNLIFVINPYRTHTRTFKELFEMKIQLEEIGGLNVTGIVANPHFMDKTKPEECVKGIEKVMLFAQEMKLPLLFGMAERSIFQEVRKLLSKEIPLWSLKREILLPWESSETSI